MQITKHWEKKTTNKKTNLEQASAICSKWLCGCGMSLHNNPTHLEQNYHKIYQYDNNNNENNKLNPVLNNLSNNCNWHLLWGVITQFCSFPSTNRKGEMCLRLKMPPGGSSEPGLTGAVRAFISTLCWVSCFPLSFSLHLAVCSYSGIISIEHYWQQSFKAVVGKLLLLSPSLHKVG